MHIQSLGQEDPLEQELATHSSILAWKIPEQRNVVGQSPRGHKESDMTEPMKVKVLVAQSCQTLCDPTNSSLPGSSFHGTSRRQGYWSGLPFQSQPYSNADKQFLCLQSYMFLSFPKLFMSVSFSLTFFNEAVAYIYNTDNIVTVYILSQDSPTSYFFFILHALFHSMCCKILLVLTNEKLCVCVCVCVCV